MSQENEERRPHIFGPGSPENNNGSTRTAILTGITLGILGAIGGGVLAANVGFNIFAGIAVGGIAGGALGFAAKGAPIPPRQQ